MNQRWTYVAFAANVLVWGYNWVPLHLLLAHVGPATLSGARVAGGALALFIALLVSRRTIAFPRSPMFVVVGLLQVSGMIGLSTFALLYGDVARTTILLFTMPFWAMLFSRIVLKERINGRRWIAIGIAMLGLTFIALHAAGSARSLLGAGFAVLAGACWAGGSVVAKRYLSGDDLLSGVMWQQFVGALPLIALALIAREPLSFPSTTTLALFAFVAIIGSGLGWLLWATVLTRVTTSTASLGALAIPVIAALAAFLQLHERPDGVQLAGLGAILAAIAVASWPQRMASFDSGIRLAPNLLAQDDITAPLARDDKREAITTMTR
ncbi:MAG: DMT family transporter [Candidatus Eremiobacteraeota bacterium]|nr:DMT family transporter [Candidatus Eremiobacteraeota bacterium]